MRGVQVYVKYATYRNAVIQNKTFILKGDYKEGSKGGHITVEGVEGWPGERRINVKLGDFKILKPGQEITMEDGEAPGSLAEAMTQPDETDAEILERINERFQILEDMTDAVANGDVRSVIVTGAPGIGKTFGVAKKLDMYKVADEIAGEGTHYQIVKGKLSPIGLYCKLYEFKDPNCVLVFDDSDGIFYEDETLNLLKAALDSGKKRTLFWQSDSRLLSKTDIPNSFDFEGGIIFITNVDFDHIRSRTLQDHLQALKSRCHFINLTIHTPREKMLRIEDLVRNSPMLADYQLADETVEEIMQFVIKYKEDFPELSLRTVLKIADLARAMPDSWVKKALVTVVGQ